MFRESEINKSLAMTKKKKKTKNRIYIFQVSFFFPFHCHFLGTAGDSLGYHRGMAFTTKDRDNDKNSGNCASHEKGAWWYNNCHWSNLNGLYLHGKIDDRGMSWYYWKNTHYSVKRSEMKIRPKGF